MGQMRHNIITFTQNLGGGALCDIYEIASEIFIGKYDKLRFN
jgi:hypothetical protein